MLAGSSTFLSPRHKLSIEAPTQFQPCNFPSMSTQRLDLPRNFSRKDGNKSSSQSIRPLGLSIEKPIDGKASGCSLRHDIKLPPTPVTEGGRREKRDQFTEKTKKRCANEASFDEESCLNRVKRKRGNGKSDEEVENLSLSQFASGNFWFQDLKSSQVPFSLSCSGEEERKCFVSSQEVVRHLPPLSNIPWFDSVITEVTDLGEKKVGTSRLQEEAGSSSNSSESEGLVLRLSGNRNNPVEHEIGHGSTPPNPNEVVVGGHNGGNNHMEHDCIELINLLVTCVEHIGSMNIPATNHCLARLGEIASPRGTQVHRLVCYYTEALALRVARLWPHVFTIIPPREFDTFNDESDSAWRLLNHVSPVPKFVHFTSNEILLRAFAGKDRVHIIDFDVKQGLQWPSLFQSLASRRNPPSHVRITVIGKSKQEMVETGERLAGFAGALGLPFAFHPVVDRLEDVRLWMLHVKENESVAVNCMFQMHKMLHDVSGRTLNDFLGLIRSTRAEIVVMAEQEGAHNEGSLSCRVSESLKYYSAFFDSIDSALPFESLVRVRIEEMFACEIRNIVACEGFERFERHETFGKWKHLMEQGRFRNVGTVERDLLQGQMLLKMYGSSDYRVEKQEHERDSITLSWLGQPLYTVSAWRPVEDDAGTSYSQPI